ncbi:hypothetical protein PAXRUDRAFT_176364 [Paxillus rubicundulus Ve08.2h10]|uniref:DUF8040 domain-containing protein n=1 Tax=Paxillus rubicundulus Ve08.2h10 TaxID=930991 RepID=A0A0D0CT88_9AGAM|nr:hypothetical protein PAXRUDRAFT_176364 [Paxillus rubicundulus Ve08.2h10]
MKKTQRIPDLTLTSLKFSCYTRNRSLRSSLLQPWLCKRRSPSHIICLYLLELDGSQSCSVAIPRESAWNLVSTSTFNILINKLQSQGYTHSEHITIEEQLSIFLYACVMGLMIRHIREWFQ